MRDDCTHTILRYNGIRFIAKLKEHTSTVLQLQKGYAQFCKSYRGSCRLGFTIKTYVLLRSLSEDVLYILYREAGCMGLCTADILINVYTRDYRTTANIFFSIYNVCVYE